VTLSGAGGLRQSSEHPWFRRIFREHYGFIWATLRRFGVAERDREDVASDVFLRINAQLHAYDADRPLRPWLFVFAFRAAADYRRLARHRLEVHVDIDIRSSAPSPDEDVALRERQRLALSALDILDEDRRAVFVMHDLEEMSVPEIAAALAIPEGTAYTRLRAARTQFTAAVRRLQTEGVKA
jgi:RNA polymerase sigma-70 factor (ECF subfamily)